METPPTLIARDRPGSGGGAELLAAVESLRRKACGYLLGSRVCRVLSAVLTAALALGVIDYALRLPDWLRAGLWLVGLASFAWAIRSYLLPAWRFRPALSAVALRAERADPGLRGLLASAVDFSGAQPARGGDAMTRALSQRVVNQAAARWGAGGAARGVIDSRGYRRAALWLALIAATAGGLYAASPALWSIGAVRVLWPLAGASWPQRTMVADVTHAGVHPLGSALPLRAAVALRSGAISESTYAAVRYRSITTGPRGESVGAEQRELLTWQEREIELPAEAADTPVKGGLFERLIEPMGQALEYRFETEDDRTEWTRVRLVERPRVVGATAEITPPEYARALASDVGGGPAATDIRADLGPGTDDRALAPSALAGSRVTMSIRLNKPVPPPVEVLDLLRASGGGGGGGGVSPEDAAEAPVVEHEGEVWTLRWVLRESLRLNLSLVDEHGIESIEESNYRFDATEDRPATAVVTDPANDRTVLPTARLRVAGEGRDDVGLHSVALEQRHYRPAQRAGSEPSGPGGALEESGPPVILATTSAAGARAATVETQLELTAMALKPGDEVRLAVLAKDVFSLGGAAREAARSSPRILRVISAESLAEEIRRQLAEVRQGAIRIQQQQRETRERTAREGSTAAVRRAQSQVSERLERTDASVARLVERIDENGLNDSGLQDLLEAARESLRRAGESSSAASSSLGEAPAREEPDSAEQPPAAEGAEQSKAKPSASAADGSAPQESRAGGSQQSSPAQSPAPDGESSESGASPAGEPGGASGQPSGGGSPQQAPPQQPKPATEAQPKPAGEEQPGGADPAEQRAAEEQQRVEDELSSLIEMLDRGEDNWVVRNQIERLAREQRELQARTKSMVARTAGRSLDQLTPDEQSELQKIEEQQSKLADQSRQLQQEMRQREQALRQKDPAGAAGIARARQRAEQDRLSETMSEAARQAGQNQSSNAQQSQERAASSLEQMLEDLEETQRARDEALRRQLASVIESLRALIAGQTEAIAALDAVVAAGGEAAALSALDRGMIRLNQNTLGVLDLIKESGPELAAVASPVSRASEAQQRAIASLRAAAPDGPAAREHESRSLELLTEALKLAEQSQETLDDRQQRQKTAELKRRYREILEQQTALRGETEPYAAAGEPSRRDRIMIRKLGERQQELRALLSAMPEETKELREAKVFDYAHRSLDRVLDRAVGSLADARAGTALPDQDAAIGMLKGLLDALQDPKPDQQFSEGASSGGGGSGGQQNQPLLPPAKELKLLKGLMTELNRQTAELDNAGQADAGTVSDLATAHRDVTAVAEDLVKRMEQRGRPPAGPEDVLPIPPIKPPEGDPVPVPDPEPEPLPEKPEPDPAAQGGNNR